MGSFDGECVMCQEIKSIRVECFCGAYICEDCRDDHYNNIDDTCDNCNSYEEEINTEKEEINNEE